MAHGLPVTSYNDAAFDVVATDILASLLQEQEIPIVQISVIKNATPAYYYLLGQVLANLKRMGV